MKFRCGFVLLLVALLLPGATYAVQPSEMLSDAQLESRARHISESLRCLVCQNQSIDDSDADLAHDLRVLVRQRLVAGDSDEQVRQYLVDRYGDYVLLDPPMKPATYALWMGPPFFLLAGISIAWVFYRRHKTAAAEFKASFSTEEQQRLNALIRSSSPAPGDEIQQTKGKAAP